MRYRWSAVVLTVGLALGSHAGQMPPAPTAPQRMAWAAQYLHQAITPSGRFVYIRHPDPQQAAAKRNRYNLLRHAGTLFALADYHSVFAPDPEQGLNLRRAARYLIGCCVGPVAQAPGALAIWSHPAVVGRPDAPLQAKLGGAGLALAALLSLDRVVPGVSEPELWRGLGEFLLFMQHDDGGFVAKYIPVRGGPDPAWVSLYYPGEAALGLVMLFERDPDPRWLQAAVDALRYLARTRERQSAPPPDHWALIATARLLRQPSTALEAVAPAALPWAPRNDREQGLRGLLIAHAEAVVDAMLAEQGELIGRPCGEGGFNPEGRVAPTATRLEGLLAALEFLPGDPRREAVEAAVSRGLAFLTASQVEEGAWRGGYTRVAPACPTPSPRANEIRIDYVQHALSAQLEASRRLHGHSAQQTAAGSGSAGR